MKAFHPRAGSHVAVLLTLLLVAAAGSACRRAAPQPDAASQAPPALDVGPENVVQVAREEIRTGPRVSGELRAAHEATVRAEVGGSVLRVGPDAGESVRAGVLLAEIEARAQRDAVASAQSSLRSVEQGLDVARREAQRTASLVKAGALAERDLELAQSAATAAQAQVDDARARLISAQKVLGDATVRAPMTGVVSRRHVSAGDVVSPGTELYTIIDPSSMRLEASVPSEDLGAVSVGAPVVFEVRGYPGQTFEGRVARISPAADPVTRQVPIFVEIPNTGARLVAGLFAEGRVARESRQALVAPASAVNDTGARPWVLRIRGDAAERVEVTLGLRDERTERVEIVSGVQAGDRLLVGAAQGISPGTPVRVRAGQAGE
jgi:RND family efflux transporter MFP subunit